MIVQPGDFVGEISIANTAQAYVAAELVLLINEYEPEFLTELLGEDLYAQLTAGLLVVPIDPIWTALVAEIGPAIAYYIYWWWTVNNNSQTVTMGEVKPKSANAAVISPNQKMCRTWNKMVNICFDVVKFINDNQSDYGVYYNTRFYYENSYGTSNCRPEIFHKNNIFDL